MSDLTSRRRTMALALGIVLVTIAAACGQKPGVHDEAADALPEIIIETGAGGGVAAGSADGATDGATGTDAGSGTTGAAGGTGGTTDGGSTGGSDGSPAAGSLQLTGSDRTGVSDTTINLAVHAPVTGAAPLPASSFEKAADLYWRYVTEIKKEKVLGRSTVRVAFKDDKYTPNTAIQACRELASSSFLLVGAGGTDQIQACAQFAEQSKVPYLSAGVTEAGLKGLKYYFASSMTYAQQTELLAQYVKKTYPGKKVGAIITDTPNFDDAASAWDAAAKRHGLSYYKT
ncbi:MAG: ABC transporter substrate-binding protein, partial [Acidimicrobiales bacterium]